MVLRSLLYPRHHVCFLGPKQEWVGEANRVFQLRISQLWRCCHLGLISVCCVCVRCLVHCISRMFSSILGLYPLDVSSIPQPLPNFCCCDTCEKCLQMLGNIFLRSEITPIEISSSRGLSPSRLASLCYSPGTLESAQVLETTFSLFTDKKMNA